MFIRYTDAAVLKSESGTKTKWTFRLKAQTYTIRQFSTLSTVESMKIMGMPDIEAVKAALKLPSRPWVWFGKAHADMSSNSSL